MRKVNNFKWNKLTIIPIFTMLFFTANLFAQNAVAVSQNDNNKLIIFIEEDADNDNFQATEIKSWGVKEFGRSKKMKQHGE